MKTVYISFLLHGNMCYDRYTKQEIREKFPGSVGERNVEGAEKAFEFVEDEIREMAGA